MLFLATRVSLTYLLVALMIVSFGFCVWYTTTEQSFAFYMPFTRFWELLSGALLAAKFAGKKLSPDFLSAKTAGIASAAGLVLIGVAFFAFDRTSSFPGWRAALPVVGAMLVVLSTEFAGANYILSNRLMTAIGLVSYPFYLLHWPLLTFAKTRAVGKPSTISRLLIIALCLAIAVLIYRYIEKPLRKSGRAIEHSWKLATLLAGAAVVGTVIFQLGGLPNRWAASFGDDVAAYQRSQSKLNLGVVDCEMKARLDHATCHSFSKFGNADVAIIGDSHAGAIFPAISAQFAKSGKQNMWIGENSCPFLLGFERDSNCGSDPDKIFDYLKEAQGIHDVLLISRWSLYANNQWYGAAEENEGEQQLSSTIDSKLADPRAILLTSLSASLTALFNSSKEVTLVLNVPEMGVLPSRCLARPLREHPPACQVAKKDYQERSAAMGEIVMQLQQYFPRLRIIDPSTLLCDTDFCKAKLDGKFMYSDDDHLSEDGANFVVERLFKATN